MRGSKDTASHEGFLARAGLALSHALTDDRSGLGYYGFSVAAAAVVCAVAGGASTATAGTGIAAGTASLGLAGAATVAAIIPAFEGIHELGEKLGMFKPEPATRRHAAKAAPDAGAPPGLAADGALAEKVKARRANANAAPSLPLSTTARSLNH